MIRTAIIIYVIILVVSCKTPIERVAEKTKDSNIIRVKLTTKDEIDIPIKYNLVFEDDYTKKKIKFSWKQKKMSICFKNNMTMLNERPLKYPINIYSKNSKLIRLNNRKYFGTFKIIPDGHGFEVINYIPVETYLMSVLLSEVPISFHIEALKSQVVVARTYAYLFIKKYSKRRREFDVDDTTRYQVYKGHNLKLERKYLKKLENAIKETSGIIVTYDNSPITAYFHSNSGGKIRSGKDYFGQHSDFPYLTSKDDPYSIGYPCAKWEYSMPIKNFIQSFDLSSDLTDDYFVYNKDGFVEEMNISSDLTDDYFIYNKDGFAEEKNILDYSFNSKEIRRTIGYSLIKSERFRIEILPEENKIFFYGIGYGHGVGMSQWGAQGMAENGFGFKEIIAFYYPQTEIKLFTDEN